MAVQKTVTIRNAAKIVTPLDREKTSIVTAFVRIIKKIRATEKRAKKAGGFLDEDTNEAVSAYLALKCRKSCYE